jgi:hypothetical protein
MAGRHAEAFAAERGRAGRAGARRRVAGSLVGLAVLLAAGLLDPILAQDRVEGHRYQNARYGIQIEKPASWHFITASTIMDLARRAARMPPLGSDVDPVKAAGLAVIVSKVPVLGRDMVPMVLLKVSDQPQAPTSLMEECERLRSGMTEPETVTPTRSVSIDGRPAARLDFKGYVDGALVRATALCTFRGSRAFVVVGQALAAEFDGEASVFDTILRSFKLQ